MPEIKKLNKMEVKSLPKAYELRKIKKESDGNLGSKSDKEQEIEDLLSEEEDLLKGVKMSAEKEIEKEKLAKNYKRIEKQGMSDQGIVSPEELKEFGKDVYKGAKAGVKKLAKGAMETAKAGVKKVKEYMD